MDGAKGWIVLEGGAEFGGRMAGPDLAAVSRAGGFSAPVKILPTAALTALTNSVRIQKPRLQSSSM
jgi:hypothetical protein